MEFMRQKFLINIRDLAIEMTDFELYFNDFILFQEYIECYHFRYLCFRKYIFNIVE